MAKREPEPATQDEKNAAAWAKIFKRQGRVVRTVRRSGGAAAFVATFPKKYLRRMKGNAEEMLADWKKIRDELGRLLG